MPRARHSARGGRRRGGHSGGGEDGGERWLLTYADMITLLMALFMVLFSISSINISKVQALQLSLRAAFSGDILPGGKAIAQPGATANSSKAPSTADVQAIVPLTAQTTGGSKTVQSGPATSSASTASSATATTTATATTATNTAAAQREASQFTKIKHQLDAYAAKHGFGADVHTSIDQQGLVIRVLTDRLLFASGQATLIPAARPLLGEISNLLSIDREHPISVEGNTDDVPIQSSSFPSNWELSTARASMVVRELISQGTDAHRLSAAGYADLRPITSNATAQGRARNRRVEIVLQRLYKPPTTP